MALQVSRYDRFKDPVGVIQAYRMAKKAVPGLQVANHHTGFLVNSPEGAALRMRYLLHHQRRRLEMGQKGRPLVRDNFLLTSHLREYLTLMVSLTRGGDERLYLN